MNFIKEQSEASPPFFMMVATPACHAPFTPAPQYKENFNTSKAPRTPSFNTAGGSVSVIKLVLLTVTMNPQNVFFLSQPTSLYVNQD